ncbi:MAG: radical SAM protein [archaeon]
MWAVARPDALRVLSDEKCKRSLRRYFSILNEGRLAKFKIARTVGAEFSTDASLQELWSAHSDAIRNYWKAEEALDQTNQMSNVSEASSSLLKLKEEIAKRIIARCSFCHRRCGVNRDIGESGFCGCGDQVELSSYFQHMGEEPELVPSGTIFTYGCTMRCLHCQNWTISQHLEARNICSTSALASIVDHLGRSGSRNVNLVGGDPTSWLYHWLDTFTRVKENIPVVWNSNSYYSEETALLLGGFVDLYLLDFKYGPESCAEQISSAPEYWQVATRNHLAAKESGELIIRVLVLPGHNECCTKPILTWISKNLGSETRINLMDQYRPEWRAEEVENLGRRLTRSEFEEACQIARKAGLVNVIS